MYAIAILIPDLHLKYFIINLEIKNASTKLVNISTVFQIKYFYLLKNTLYFVCISCRLNLLIGIFSLVSNSKLFELIT